MKNQRAPWPKGVRKEVKKLSADHGIKVPFCYCLGVAEDISPCIQRHAFIGVQIVFILADDSPAVGKEDGNTVIEFLYEGAVFEVSRIALGHKSNFLNPLPSMRKSILPNLP